MNNYYCVDFFQKVYTDFIRPVGILYYRMQFCRKVYTFIEKSIHFWPLLPPVATPTKTTAPETASDEGDRP